MLKRIAGLSAAGTPTARPPARRARLAVEQLEARDVPNASPQFAPGELLVSFKPGVSQAEIGRFYAAHGFSEREALDGYTQGNAGRLKLVAVPAARTAALASVLGRDPLLAYAEPNYVYTNVAAAATPTEPLYAAQWHLNNTGQFGNMPDADIDAPEAWSITTGSPDVLVAVLDSGVDYDHPDLVASIWTNPAETPGDGLDNDGNGYADDVHGYDFVNKDGDPMADDANGPKPGHGTGVTGIIGATPFNEGTVGVAWRVGIIPIKVISAADTLKTSDAVKAFQYVNYLKAVQGRNIVATNNSYILDASATGPSRALRDAMAGLDQPGMSPILHVGGPGNANANVDVAPTFPASYDLDNIVSVAATDWNDRYADFSSYGAVSVDLAAPGASMILTTAPGNRYDFTFNGVSAAIPQVTGATALVASAFPGLTAAQIKQRILNGVDPIGHIGTNSQKPTLTNGRLNVANALAGAPTDNDLNPPAAVGGLAVATTTFHTVTLNWIATGDDGTVGRAGFYDLRYATSPITNATWGAATRALGEPGPKPAGSAETFAVSGLDPDTTYYFALRARDDMGNESAPSNVGSGTTAPAAVVFADDMEHGLNGWTATGLWHQSVLRSNSPETSWYYGQESTRNYDTGAANGGLLVSPAINLKNPTHPVLIYREWRQVEDITFADSARLEVGTGQNNWQAVSQSEFSTAVDPLNWQYRAATIGWNTPVESPFSTPQWVSRSIDLSAYAGKTIQLRFAFDTGDELFNDFEGWYVDDVSVLDAAGVSAAFGGGSPATASGGTLATPLPEPLPTGGAALATAPGNALRADDRPAGLGLFAAPDPWDGRATVSSGTRGEGNRVGRQAERAQKAGQPFVRIHAEYEAESPHPEGNRVTPDQIYVGGPVAARAPNWSDDDQWGPRTGQR